MAIWYSLQRSQRQVSVVGLLTRFFVVFDIRMPDVCAYCEQKRSEASCSSHILSSWLEMSGSNVALSRQSQKSSFQVVLFTELWLLPRLLKNGKCLPSLPLHGCRCRRGDCVCLGDLRPRRCQRGAADWHLRRCRVFRLHQGRRPRRGASTELGARLPSVQPALP